ncbi:hypothetical protein CKO40_16340 [Halochromatium glycolicum]|uniref:DUF4417 domain-containing protein n=1 Tax=Halochromatium glycolicum TaxID=85075 RepID=A0AAJ0U6A4_9GAMM|nr:hypothetical protein [Halochromatium glycolicum]
MTRSSANWSAHPGGYDALHCERHVWPSDSPHGIPSLLPQTFDLPPNLRLLPYRSRLDRLDPTRDRCHFYLDDYRFESTWTRLDIGARHVAGYFATLTPDFSLYPDWPLAGQIWNTYRARWLGRYWQAGGLPVIPTVNWSDTSSTSYCSSSRSHSWTPSPPRNRCPMLARPTTGLLEQRMAVLPDRLAHHRRIALQPLCPAAEGVIAVFDRWRSAP